MFSELRDADSDVLDAPKYLKLVSSELTSLHISWDDTLNDENAEINYEVSYYRLANILA